jgi:diguanylate cyclase (GGDEF)-like protein
LRKFEFAERTLRGKRGIFGVIDLRRAKKLWLGAASFCLKQAPAILLAAALSFLGVMAERQSRKLENEQTRSATLSSASLIQAKLEEEISGDVALTRGAARALAAEPSLPQQGWAQLAMGVIGEKPQILALATVPNQGPVMVYPSGAEVDMALEGVKKNETTAIEQGAANALTTRIDGPVALTGGGEGFFIRQPVLIQNLDGDPLIWGDVYALVDAGRLYHSGGALNDKAVDLAISPVKRDTGEGQASFGDENLKRENPVVVDVRLPSGRWRIAARPSGGWDATSASDWIRRFVIAIGGLLIVAPVALVSHLVDERRGQFIKLRDREESLQRLSERLTLALDASKIGVWELDLVTGALHWDKRMHDLYDYPLGDGARAYEDWRDRLDPSCAEQAIRDFQSAIDYGSRYESQYALILPGRRSRVIRAIGKVYEVDGAKRKIIGLNWDVTLDFELTNDLSRAKTAAEARNVELEAARKRIEYVSLHDFLTKLPNRMYLDRRLDEFAARCSETGRGVALLHIDLDRFKEINDTLGHLAGDAMLVHTAEIIRRRTGEGGFVARIGGDEFVILSMTDGDHESFASLAQELIADVRPPIVYQGHECRFGMSIGIAGAFGADVDRQRLLVNADIALYRAKKNGGNCFVFFTEALQSQIIGDKRLADSIMRGLERGEFIPYYQPQIDVRTHELVGVEALARWRHPTRGILPPGEFIKIAEDVGVVGAIDRAVLEQSLKQIRRWRMDGVPVPRISVNVSLRRLQDEMLLESLKSLDIEPGAISFELVESIYLDERDDRFAEIVAKIKALGIDIEIDDFGTGYASIVSLTKLRPRRLKIDRQLVQPIVHAPTQRKLIKAIVDIAKSLNIGVIAEGVETMEHAQLLRDLGCDVLQGYVFAKPLTVEELEHFLLARPRKVAI